MANIFSRLFGSKFPSTEKYENEYNHLRKEQERFHQLEKSTSINRYLELDKLVHSGEFKQKVLKIKKERFKHTEAFQQLKKYKEYKRSNNVKRYHKLLRKGKANEAEELKKTAEIQTYLSLKNYVESAEFNQIKSDMNDKNRFKKSSEYQLQEEYKGLLKSEDVIWFLKTKKNFPFKHLDKWSLTFEDNFDGTSLDEKKWLTGYYWGKILMNDNYVQANEKQFFKKENIELRDSCVRIVSKSEACKGKVWDPKIGFVPKDFQFSSGIINTGQSFRQQYGKFEAKVKFSHATPAIHSFILLSEQMSPQINILKTPEQESNKIEAGYYWTKDGHVSKLAQDIEMPGSSDNFYIYTLEWTKNKMEWKINGVTVHSQMDNIPQKPMYISFSTHFTDMPEQDELPISMDIDWVRCYQLN